MTSDPDAQVVAALRQRGFMLQSVYDLVNTKQPYPDAIPVLVMYLSEVEDLGTKEGLVRALTVKEAKGLAGPALIREFRALPLEAETGVMDHAQMVKWAIGNALSVVATDSDTGDILQLIGDERHGKARERLVVALGRLRDRRASEAVLDLLERGGELAGHAVVAAGLQRLATSRELVTKFLNDREAWVRREAKKTLKRLDG